MEELRSFGYICPRCGRAVMASRSVFSLTAAAARIECECGKAEMDIETDGARYRLSVPFHQNTLQYFFDRELNYVAADIYSQYTDAPVHVAYTGFQSTVAGPFPYHMQATATVGSRMFSLGCDFQRPVFDSAPRFDTSLPSNYQIFDITTLLKALL